MSWAKVGAKCVCIKTGSFTRIKPGPETWTIKYLFHAGGELHAVFEELPTGGERVARFRPIVSKTESQDVQMFKRIAEKAPSLEDAE